MGTEDLRGRSTLVNRPFFSLFIFFLPFFYLKPRTDHLNFSSPPRTANVELILKMLLLRHWWFKGTKTHKSRRLLWGSSTNLARGLPILTSCPLYKYGTSCIPKQRHSSSCHLMEERNVWQQYDLSTPPSVKSTLKTTPDPNYVGNCPRVAKW